MRSPVLVCIGCHRPPKSRTCEPFDLANQEIKRARCTCRRQLVPAASIAQHFPKPPPATQYPCTFGHGCTYVAGSPAELADHWTAGHRAAIGTAEAAVEADPSDVDLAYLHQHHRVTMGLVQQLRGRLVNFAALVSGAASAGNLNADQQDDTDDAAGDFSEALREVEQRGESLGQVLEVIGRARARNGSKTGPTSQEGRDE